jgi:hypothetical protein
VAVLSVRDNANPDCSGVDVKGQVVPVHAMEDNRRSSGIAARIVSVLPPPPPQGKCCRFPFNGRFGWVSVGIRPPYRPAYDTWGNRYSFTNF